MNRYLKVSRTSSGFEVINVKVFFRFKWCFIEKYFVQKNEIGSLSLSTEALERLHIEPRKSVSVNQIKMEDK